jgi:hypothetical protein
MRSCCEKSSLYKHARATILFFVLMVREMSMAMAAENTAYEEQRLFMLERIEAILIDKNVCNSLRDCRERQFVFVSPGKKGIAIATYGITNKEVLLKICEEASRLFYLNDFLSVEIEHFAFTKEAELRTFFKVGKAFATIRLER